MRTCNPLISVIMPVHNAEEFIEESIDSILSQSYGDFEFIIIDDGSTDSSVSIVESVKDPRIKLLKQDRRGIAIALNKAIAVSSGSLIARQDADDVSMPERFLNQVSFMEQHPEVAMVGTFSQLIDQAGDIIKLLEFPTLNEELQQYIRQSNPFIHGSIILRKSVLKAVGMYREQFLLSQSYDLWLRISEQYPVANIAEHLYKYRVWENAVSNEKAALNSMFNRIALELAAERRLTGSDTLMSGNNYSFYEKYGKDIVDSLGKKEIYRWIK